MNPPGRIKKAPDFGLLIQHYPHLLVILYQGKMWRWRTCGTCTQQFWKSTTPRKMGSPFLKHTYCSKACQLEGYRVTNTTRQRRWKKRRAAGLVNHKSPQARHGRQGGLNWLGVPRPRSIRVRVFT